LGWLMGSSQRDYSSSTWEGVVSSEVR
jgi:hypothetical protein